MENMGTTYGSAHTRLRRLVARAFTPRRVEAMRATIKKSVASLLEDLAGSPPGAIVDLKSRYAHPLAAEVIFELIGVPAEARQTILRGGEAQVDTTMTEEEEAASIGLVLQEMAALVAAKRRTPADDLTSDLIGAQDGEDGSGLEDGELIGTLLFLLGTGTEPVTNLVTNSILALLANPGQRQLIDAGQASWQDAIEETLRMDAPVAHMPFRFAVEDVQLGDVTIPAGDPVLVNFAAMGRDPAIHGATAGSFDIARPDKKHLAFGHGMYVCLGMRLGLLETGTAVPALFERFPDLALAVGVEEVKPQNTFIMNGRSELPVLLSATQQ
ncbi:cytochrome P450 [Streptomyces sp. SID13031]|uniref:cytochrome P450 n=1 Tax=Streptomyces sp. SID13031 TaxID=2706046 RepID=UPI001EF3832D|nr:cytochrome P450 [Streptomyces sp. SID13031]